MTAEFRCTRCRDTGHHVDDPETGAQVYCECPIGKAFQQAWDQRVGNEEAAVAAIERMRAFLLGRLET